MAQDNAAQSIKDLGKDLENLNKKIIESIKILESFDVDVADLFAKARESGIANTDKLVDYLAKRLSNLQLKNFSSPFLAAFDEKEIDRAAKKYAALLEKQDVVEKARSIAVGGRKFGELQGEDLKKWREFSSLLATINEQKKQIEQETAGAADAGKKLYDEQLAFKKAQEVQSQEKKRLAQEEVEAKRKAAEDEKQLIKEIKEEEKRAKEEALQRYKEEKAYLDDVEKRKHKTKESELKEAFGQQSKQKLESEMKMNKAVQQQITYYRQLHSLYKEYKALQAKPNKTKEDNAVLEQTKQKILEILRLSKQLELENKGSAAIAKQATEFERVRDRAREARGETQKMQKSLQNLLPTLQRLASAFGVAFSVRGLAQFGKKLIETRGEFEMQFVAMKQIIGDVDAATKIWNQTMQQALQSPFKAMQLVTYTKQLAAYRIETEKLFDTTKRLADVSAGLGVDMGRLILAFGQVKSANFLRASEVRQFTEAGVNIVGNLAKYFTELEGRAVSTADVMERITKRMVMFSDVEEIFRRMTDEGGEFYKMQEVQADTVKGQIAKLHDAYDQMLNTIGQANQGTLRKYIESLNELVRNWRTVASFIMKNVNAMVVLVPLIATYRKGAKMAAGETFTWSKAMKQLELELAFGRAGIKKFSLSTALGTAAVYTFKGAVELTKMALRTFVPFIAIEGLLWLVTKMGEANRTAKQLSKTLDEVGGRNAQSLQDNIDGFTDLVERLKQANEGSQEYLDIRNKIQSQYGEYLDNLSLEQITVENLANAYDKVVERMREKSRQHIMEEGLQEIANTYGDAMVKFQKELSGFKFTSGLKVSDKEASDIAKKMYEMYLKDERYRGLQNPVMLLQNALKQYYGEDAVKGLNYAQLSTGNAFYKSIENRYKKQLELETKANALTKATSDTHAEYLEQLSLEEAHKERIKEINSDPSVLSTERKNVLLQAEEVRYAEEKLELQARYQKKGDEWLKAEKEKLKENYGAFLNAYNEQVKAYIGGRFGEGWMQGDNKDAWDAYRFMIANQDRLSQGQTKWEEKILSDKKITEEHIQRIKEQQATQTAADSEAAKALNESLKQEEDRLELIKKQMELLGLHEKQKGGSGSANNSIYGERIRLLQDMLQKYKQLAKEAYGYAKAEGKVAESFDDAWAEIMPKGYGALEVPTSYADLKVLLERLESFTPKFDKNGKLTKQFADLKKAIADALSQVDIEMSVRIREDFGKQMEKAFNDYELTLELDKLNISPEAAKDLFPEFDSQTLGELQDAMQEFYKKQGASFDEEDLKAYKQWSDKIDAEILKSRKEKAKQYSKYLEKEYSERAKVEMQYAKDVAFVTANFNGEQQQNILKGIEGKYQKDINELTWKSFKESAFYVEMMDDLSSVPADYMKIMLDKIEELLAHPETLSPRALKEAINARQKILEAQMNINSLAVMRQSTQDIREAANDVGGTTWMQTKKRLDEEQKAQAERLDSIEREIRANETLQGQLKGLEDVQQAEANARAALSSETNVELGELEDVQSLINEYQASLAVKTSQLENSADANSDSNAALEREISDLRIAIALLEEYNRAKQGRMAYEGTAEGQAAVAAQIGGQTSTSVGATITRKRGEADNISNRLSKLKQWQKAFKNFSDGMSKWNASVADAITKVGAMGDAFYDTFDALGGETNALTEGWKEFGDTMVQTITQALTLIPQLVAGFIAAGTSINAAMGLIGLIAEAVQLILVAVGVVAKLHDARYEREIEIQQKKIDNLQRAYDRLEKSIEKTWDTASYIRTYNEETQNLYEQIEALNKQINAEESKKNADADKIQGYKDSIQDAEDGLDELKQKQIEVFGGIGRDSYRSAAEGFVDAWKSAFLETGDGLQGLQDHFDEFLNDWFVNQATMQGVGTYYEGVFDYINKIVEKGKVPTRQDIENARLLADEAAAKSDELMQAYASIFGLGGEGALSGLAAGIQGMTEEQANILEAYWNSVRGYTASIDMNVATIVGLLSNGTGGGGGGKGNIFGDPNVNTNPMLQQLSLIAANTQATHQLLQSVTKSGHSLGGAGIKVFVD